MTEATGDILVWGAAVGFTLLFIALLVWGFRLPKKEEEMMKVYLTTTFKRLHSADACKDRYRHLAKALGGISKYGRTKPINLLTILEHNGLADFFWVLRTVTTAAQAATVDAIMAKGQSWYSAAFWSRESATIRRDRVASIKRYLK